MEGATLSGTVEVDGAYVGGHIRPANLKKDRKDRRLAEHQTGKRRVVVVARERSGRTLTTVTRHEADGVDFVAKVVRPGSQLHADEASHWDALHAKFQTLRINHQIGYSIDGACTNQAESFLSRIRRMIDGQHHHVSPQYLYQYAKTCRVAGGPSAPQQWRAGVAGAGAGAQASGQPEQFGRDIGRERGSPAHRVPRVAPHLNVCFGRYARRKLIGHAQKQLAHALRS